MRLEGKISIITGGGGGIGRAVAMHFAKEGSKIVIADTPRSNGRKTVNEVLDKYPTEALFIETDVSDFHEVDKMVDETFERFKKIDVMVNCAGIYEDSLLLDMRTDEWDRTIRINLYGCFYCTRAAGSHMKSQGNGSIINISSIGGQKAPSLGHSHYAASKAGMIGFTRAAAAELAAFGIRVNNICPGVTEGTPMGDRAIGNVSKEYLKTIPLGRFATPDDIAYGALYLASDESSYITGSTLSINGGIFME